MKILTIAVLIAKEIPTSKDEIFLMAEKMSLLNWLHF